MFNFEKLDVWKEATQATIAKRQGFLSEADYQRLYTASEKQSKMRRGLGRSLLEQPH